MSKIWMNLWSTIPSFSSIKCRTINYYCFHFGKIISYYAPCYQAGQSIRVLGLWFFCRSIILDLGLGNLLRLSYLGWCCFLHVAGLFKFYVLVVVVPWVLYLVCPFLSKGGWELLESNVNIGWYLWLRETSFSPKLCFFFNIGLALRVLFFSGSIILAMNTSRAPFSA
jgi:hypothetical protein